MHTTQFSNVSTPYQKIPDACRSTGLSQYYLRKGCKDGTVPHIRSGTVYLVDVPALLEKLRREATGQIGGDETWENQGRGRTDSLSTSTNDSTSKQLTRQRRDEFSKRHSPTLQQEILCSGHPLRLFFS